MNGFVNSEMKNDPFQFDSDWIHRLEELNHWNSYWMQQKLMEDRIHKDDTLLEVGIGSGFCSNYIKAKGFKVTTFDIDSDKKPDIIGNIVDYDFKNVYDFVLAFEVFEHIPYSLLPNLLKNLEKKCKKGMFISIPEYMPIIFSIDIKIPKVERIKYNMRIPKSLPFKKKMTPYHHWEVNSSESTRIKNVLKLFNLYGFRDKQIILYNSQYFIYFILE